MKPNLRDTLPHKETPFLRILHILVAVLVLAQIINSNFTESEALHESGLNGIVTWIHVISGFGLIFCGIAMMAWMLTQRGFKYYFALLVLDFQPMLATAGAAVYGRDLLQARHDPWVQQAQLQASGQLAKDEEIAREREREAGLCQAPGCPYALRAPCAQPFCLEMRVGTPLAGPMAVLDVIAGRTGTTGNITRL